MLEDALISDPNVDNASTMPVLHNQELVGQDEFDGLFWDYDDEILEHLALLESQDAQAIDMSAQKLANGTPVDLLFKRQTTRLHVTDISTLEWCSLQVRKLWAHDGGIVEATAAIQEGRNVHAKLEEEAYGTERVKVKTITREDRAALKLWNGVLALDVLTETNLAREIPVYGVIHGQFIVGEVDQVSYINDHLVLEDTKTRAFSVPIRVGKPETVQVSVYKVLWDALVKAQFSSAEYLKHTGLDAAAILCEDWQTALQFLNQQIWTFGHLLHLYLSRFLFFPAIAELRIKYVNKSTSKCLPVDYDEAWIVSKVETAIGFYAGAVPAQGVPEEEAQLKCGRCKYAESCEWRIAKATEAADRGMRKALTW